MVSYSSCNDTKATAIPVVYISGYLNMAFSVMDPPPLHPQIPILDGSIKGNCSMERNTAAA